MSALLTAGLIEEGDAIAIPGPHELAGEDLDDPREDVEAPPYAPVSAYTHVRLADPGDDTGTGETRDVQCSMCGRVGELPAFGGDGAELELRCPCGGTTYERVGDGHA